MFVLTRVKNRVYLPQRRLATQFGRPFDKTTEHEAGTAAKRL